MCRHNSQLFKGGFRFQEIIFKELSGCSAVW